MRELWQGLLELLYPVRSQCILCKRSLAGAGLCPQCIQDMHVKGTGCDCCGRQGPAPLCGECHRCPPSYKLARAVGLYQGQLRQIVHQLKYRREQSLAVPMGQLLARVVQQEPAYDQLDLIIPIPLHRSRQWQRGFNQARLLARETGRHLALPVIEELIRVKATTPQTGLLREQRLTNVQGAFAVHDPRKVQGKRILLVDDVLTTGATVEAAASKLLQAGALAVAVVTLATGTQTDW